MRISIDLTSTVEVRTSGFLGTSAESFNPVARIAHTVCTSYVLNTAIRYPLTLHRIGLDGLWFPTRRLAFQSTHVGSKYLLGNVHIALQLSPDSSELYSGVEYT